MFKYYYYTAKATHQAKIFVLRIELMTNDLLNYLINQCTSSEHLYYNKYLTFSSQKK